MGIPKEEIEFIKQLNILADQCGICLSENEIEDYDRNLEQYGYENLVNYLKDIIKNRKSGERFPTISDIKMRIGDGPSYGCGAIIYANRIIWAFANWGLRYCDENFKDNFIEKIGDIEWAVVENMGGYKSLYKEYCDARELSFLRAQIKETANAIIEYNKKQKQLSSFDNQVRRLHQQIKKIGDR